MPKQTSGVLLSIIQYLGKLSISEEYPRACCSDLEHQYMQNSSQLQSGNPSNALMDERVKVCDTCGNIGRDHLLTPCDNCTNSAQHARVKLETIPPNGTCEDYIPNVKVQEDERRENPSLDKNVIVEGTNLKGKRKRSLYPRKSRTTGESPTESKRQVVLALRASKPNNNSQIQTSKTVKHKSINKIVYSEGTFGSQAKEPESNKGKSKAREGVTTQDQSSSVVVVNQESVPYQLRNRSRKCGSQTNVNQESSPYWLRERPQKLRSQAIVIEENSPDYLRDKGSLLKPSPSNAANLKPKRKLEKVYVLQKHEVGESSSFHEDIKGKGVIKSLSSNGKEKKRSQQDENPTEASTSMMKGSSFVEGVIPVSTSSKPIRPFDLNAYPEDEDDVEGVSEIPEFVSRDGTKPSGGKIAMLGDSSNGEGEEAKEKCAVDFSLQPNTSVVGTEDNVETLSTIFAPPSSALHGMDPIGCEIVEALFYIYHKEHERVKSN